MSAVLTNDLPVMAPHWKLSTGEYHQMIAAGILQEDARIELIEGELIDMAPIGPLHASVSSQINMDRNYSGTQPLHRQRLDLNFLLGNG